MNKLQNHGSIDSISSFPRNAPCDECEFNHWIIQIGLWSRATNLKRKRQSLADALTLAEYWKTEDPKDKTSVKWMRKIRWRIRTLLFFLKLNPILTSSRCHHQKRRPSQRSCHVNVFINGWCWKRRYRRFSQLAKLIFIANHRTTKSARISLSLLLEDSVPLVPGTRADLNLIR